MSGQHTQGRLRLVGSFTLVRDEQVPADERISTFATVHTTQEDARRMKACWNACDGAETEKIEALANAGGIVEAANGAVKLMSQLAAARTLLAKVVAQRDDDGKVTRDLAERIRTFLKGPQ